ncbi:50S ribosomal protein L13, partial [Arcobacter suis]|uniref:50S ribosomal protein L13 n=1 Tax=Arcobacter suis TaxID=1278212 RepID=UPI000FEBD046
MKFTQMAKANEIERDWIVVDATDKVFGRIITEVATILRGKHKPSYTPHVDCGDYVVIINDSKAKFSGTKLEDKNYYTHSEYFGSTKTHRMSD